MSSIKGLGKFLGRLNNISKEVEEDVKAVITVTTGDLELACQRDAPGAGDNIPTQHGPVNEEPIRKRNNWKSISQSINGEVVGNGLVGRVYVEKGAGDIAIWVEMGTGQDAATYLLTVPPEWREIAARYIRNKRGTIIHQPYMLNNFQKYSIQAEKEIKEIIRNIKL